MKTTAQKPPPARQTAALLAVHYKPPYKRQETRLEIQSWQELLELLAKKLPQKVKIVTRHLIYEGTVYELKTKGGAMMIRVGTSDSPSDAFQLTTKDFNRGSYETEHTGGQ